LNIGLKFIAAAFIFSGVSVAAFFLGGVTKRRPVLVLARVCVFVALGLVTAATAYMVHLLLIHDFSFLYVAEYTSGDLPPLYLFSALWAGNQGSLLIWTWLVAVIGALLVITSRARDRELMPYATAVVMITEVFLLSLMLYVNNPFEKMITTPLEGIGLTPFFKEIGIFLHVPVILAGYAGFTVPFAMAVAALLTGRLGNEWLITARRWALLSWLMLTAGMITGAWWSYTGMGGGSYWHWQPVENATLIPWLTATAWLHSIAMQRKRGVFKVWSMVLIIMTFGFVIFSFFLNRSDVITSSVNTFSKSAFGQAILGFLVAAMLVSSILVILRRRGLEGKLQIESVISKEGTFLLTNLLLIASALAILVGTVFTLLNRDAGGLHVSLAVPFLNQVNIPIFLAIILLAGICVTTGWRQVAIRSLWRSLRWPLGASLLLGLTLLLFGLRGWYPIVGLAVCCFVPFTVAAEWVKSTGARHRNLGENYPKAFFGLVWSDKPRHGGYIVHIAIILISIGIIGSSAYSVSKEAALMPGESMAIGNYSLVFEKLNLNTAIGEMIFSADISVYKNSKLIGELTPVKYYDQAYNGEVNTASVRSSPVEDLYVTIVGWDEAGLTEFKVSIYPLTMWIWIGGWLMMLGGLIAFWPERQRAENTSV
jgi:cytochrome c-type biogenesis protein CcmF